MLGNDTIICEKEILWLGNNITNADFEWQNGSKQAKLLADKSGKYWLRTKIGNCEKTDTINIIILPEPKINLGLDLLLCEDEKVGLDAKNPGAQYVWNTGETTQTIVPKTAGNYWVYIKAANCFDSDTINIDFINDADLLLGNDTTICEGEEIVLQSKLTNAKYLWSNGTKNQTFTVKESGSYWLQTITDNCELTDSININILPLPVVYLGVDENLCEGEELLLNAKNEGAKFRWSTGENTQAISAKTTGKYWVNVETGNCSTSDTINLNFCEPLIYVPNAFTPNEDNVNDSFRVYGKDIAGGTLQIYNRWGECVYESNNLKKAWDGHKNGSFCPQEMYFWILLYKSKIAPDANYKQIKGVVYLIR